MKQNLVTIGLENGDNRFSVRALDHHFNFSLEDHLTINIKTEIPVLYVTFPANGDIVRGQVYIKGNIIDDDFSSYRIFVTEVSLDQVPDSERYKPLFEASVLPRTDTLAVWPTQDLTDKDYKIWLLARDKLEHSASSVISVRIDNTLPSIEILSPKENERVLKTINIAAVASDIHLHSYRLDYTTDLATNEWLQIVRTGGFISKKRKPARKTSSVNTR